MQSINRTSLQSDTGFNSTLSSPSSSKKKFLANNSLARQISILYVTLLRFSSVVWSKNLTAILALSTSPTVMSDGVSCVLTVTCIPSKLIGGATSPPKPCPKTSVTSGTENIPINVITIGTI